MSRGEFIHTFGDAHLYNNHLEQARLQLAREPRPLPTLRINPDVKSIFDFRYEDFRLENYEPAPAYSAPRWRSRLMLPLPLGEGWGEG